MTDLTVLISPLPLYPPTTQGFSFGRRNPRPASRIMVTLESEIDPASSEEADGGHPSQSRRSTSIPRRRSRSPRFDSSLLSPPPHNRAPRPRHRPTRSRSAPPGGRKRESVPDTAEKSEEKVSSEVTVHVPFVQPAKKHIVAFPSGPTTQGGELIRPPPPLREFKKKNHCMIK